MSFAFLRKQLFVTHRYASGMLKWIRPPIFRTIVPRSLYELQNSAIRKKHDCIVQHCSKKISWLKMPVAQLISIALRLRPKGLSLINKRLWSPVSPETLGLLHKCLKKIRNKGTGNKGQEPIEAKLGQLGQLPDNMSQLLLIRGKLFNVDNRMAQSTTPWPKGRPADYLMIFLYLSAKGKNRLAKLIFLPARGLYQPKSTSQGQKSTIQWLVLIWIRDGN